MRIRVAVPVAVAFVVGLGVGLAARPSLALSKGEKVVLENERVRVIEFSLEPGVVFNKGSASSHDVVNIGTTALRAYHVELK